MKILFDYNGDVRKFKGKKDPSLIDLKNFVKISYGINDCVLKYDDITNHRLTICDDDDVADAFAESLQYVMIYIKPNRMKPAAKSKSNNPLPKPTKSFTDILREKRMKQEQQICTKLQQRTAIHKAPSFLNAKSRAVFKTSKKVSKQMQQQTAIFNQYVIDVDTQADLSKKHWTAAGVLSEVKFRMDVLREALTRIEELEETQTEHDMESIVQSRNQNKAKTNRCSVVNTVHKNIKQNVECGEKMIMKIRELNIEIKQRLQNVLKIENADGTAVTYEKKESEFWTTKTITVVKDAELYDYYKQELKRLNKIKEKQSTFIESCKSHPMWNETVRRSNAKLVYNESKRIKQNKRYESKKKKEDETKRNQKKRKMSETDEMHVVWGVPQGICNGEPPPKKRKKNDKMEEDANVDDELYQ
eukprot:130176_1